MAENGAQERGKAALGRRSIRAEQPWHNTYLTRDTHSWQVKKKEEKHEPGGREESEKTEKEMMGGREGRGDSERSG